MHSTKVPGAQHRKARGIRVLAVAGVLTVALSACAPTRISDDDITYMYQKIDIYEETDGFSADERAASRGKGNKVEDFQYEIYQVAQILPVDVEGVVVQANDVVIAGDRAVIGYNTAGSEFAGAIQVIDISNPVTPVIVAEIGFPGVDITTLALDGSTLYFGGSVDPDDPDYATYRSFLAALDLTDLSSDEVATATVDSAAQFTATPGVDPVYYFTTGITVKGSTVYASVGADPGAIFSASSSLAETLLMDSDEDPRVLDIRDIEGYHGGFIGIAGTNAVGAPANGRILVFKGDSIHENSTQEIADFGSVDAKATIEVYDNHYAFLGLSDGGFKVYFLRERVDDGDILEPLYSLNNPRVGWSSRTATNSVSYSGELLFTANGEAGFRVFLVEESLRRDNPPSPDWLTLIGFVPFDTTLQPSGDYWSANHIEYRDRTLFVAAGLGGVGVYRLTRSR